MEFFERIENMGRKGRKGGSEKAAQTLSILATAIADAPDASDLEEINYTGLYIRRVEKANRAFAKAMHAMANSDSVACIEHAERGLLHLQIASIHGHTEVVPLSAGQTSGPSFSGGGCEESIQLLGEGICRIKLLAEYKSIELSKELRRRLSTVVQNLQDAVEIYGNGDYRMAFDTALGGLVWCQYIYARLSGNALFPSKQQTKPIRNLYKLATEVGLAAVDSISRQTKDGRKKINALEGYLQSALGAYLEDDIAEMDKFIRLGEIESTALTRYVAKVKTKELVSAMQSDGRKETQPSLSFKQISSELRDLIDRHHPDPDRSLIALEALQVNVTALRRAIRAEKWKEARRLLESCRYENDVVSTESDRLTEP